MALVVSVLDYEHYRRFQWLLYAFAVLIVVAVLPLGENVTARPRWIDLAVHPLPAVGSAAVLLLALSIAAFLSDRMELLGSKRITLDRARAGRGAGVLRLWSARLRHGHGDRGADAGVLYFYGTPWTHFAVARRDGASGVRRRAQGAADGRRASHPAVPDGPPVRLHATRVTTRRRTGYNLIQSMIAVGSGALTGRGNMATQTMLDFLPEHHTDFIFAVIGERYGFVGAAVLLGSMLVLIWRALRIAVLRATCTAASSPAASASIVLFQVFVNIGMTIGIMPVTGIPLPFVSYGGTAMITFLMLVGLLEAIHLRATITPQTRGRLGQ